MGRLRRVDLVLLLVVLFVASCGTSGLTSPPIRPIATNVSPVAPPTTNPPSTGPSSPSSDPFAGQDVAMSTVARAAANPADARSFSDSVTAFGLDLYREMLAEPDLGLGTGNVVFSPTSIALALGLARAGARDETGSQMDAVLHANGPDQLEAGLNALDQALASRDGTYEDGDGTTHELTLQIANAAFAQRGWSIVPSYLDTIGSAFGAGLNLVDYKADPEAARKTINVWVSQKTEERIPDLLAPSNVTTATRLYLVNAVYLKANWVAEFPKDATAPGSFASLDGSQLMIPTMRLVGHQEVPYLRGDGWQATELRYRGPKGTTPLAMMLILPDDLASFESSVSAAQLGQLGSDLTVERTRLGVTIQSSGGDALHCGTYPYSLDLFMPRFKIGTRAELGGALEALGMPLAFDADNADFTGIHVPDATGDAIFVSKVIHQANIDVDEAGTEASAATAIGLDTTGAAACTQPLPARTITLRLDHPFLFALRDIETGTVLFMGRVVDPSAAP